MYFNGKLNEHFFVDQLPDLMPTMLSLKDHSFFWSSLLRASADGVFWAQSL
jgi:hypothetical protein